MSASLLCRAVVLSQWRRLVDRTRSHPVWATTCVVLVCVLPIALLLSGRVLARQLGPALVDLEIARAVVIGVVLPCVAGGVVVAAVADGGRSLGQQVLASPLSPNAFSLASVVLPAIAVALVAAPIAAAGLLPLALGSRGGVPGAAALGSTMAAAFLAGAAGAEAARGAWRGSHVAIGSLGVAVGALAGAASSPELAPVELTAAALAGVRASSAPIAASTCVAILCAAGWLALSASRPPARVPRRRRSARMGSTAWSSAVRAATLIVLRRADIRTGLVAGVALAAGAIAATRLTGAPAPSGTLLAGASMVIAAAPLALAIGGSLEAAECVVKTAPVPPARVVSAWAVASLTPMVVFAVTVALVASSLEGALGNGVVTVTAIATGTWAAGALAGVIVPWRPTGTVDQVAALAAFVAVAGVFSAIVGLIGPRLEALGAPAPIVAAALLGTGVGVAGLALRRQLGRSMGARAA